MAARFFAAVHRFLSANAGRAVGTAHPPRSHGVARHAGHVLAQARNDVCSVVFFLFSSCQCILVPKRAFHLRRRFSH